MDRPSNAAKYGVPEKSSMKCALSHFMLHIETWPLAWRYVLHLQGNGLVERVEGAELMTPIVSVASPSG